MYNVLKRQPTKDSDIESQRQTTLNDDPRPNNSRKPPLSAYGKMVYAGLLLTGLSVYCLNLLLKAEEGICTEERHDTEGGHLHFMYRIRCQDSSHNLDQCERERIVYNVLSWNGPRP